MENNNLENTENPLEKSPEAPYPEQQQSEPGVETEMDPKPDHGETSYKGSGKLTGKKTIITGGDSGIGRAVAIAFAREGADVLISYLDEHEDAQETARLVEEAGQKAILVPGDISDEQQCKDIINRAISEFGQLDVLVNNAAYQMSRDSIQEVSSEEWEKTFRTNIHPLFYLCKAAEEHLKPGSTIVNTTSVNAYKAPPQLIAYSATKAAIQNFTASMAQLWAEKGIRVNCVAPGPIWTPLIPATMPPEKVKSFGQDVPAFVLLASQDSSYMTGSTVQVTGGYPTI
jgi:NAD(P)-dependent dehydrogenase (short-subunit alcohol dehydrogenase family)